jgi:hypothetical protein
MSIHKVTNTFVGNGTALETTVNTLTPGKLGLFGQDQTILASAYLAGCAGESITVSETYADGSFKKSMSINGRNVTSARGKRYSPATREVWAIGYNRKTAAGLIGVVNSTDYTFNIRFKNDKSLYSERPEVLRGSFLSSAAATQLTIATQIAAVVNNGGFKTLVKAIIVGNGTGIQGLTGATAYGVEITALDINQFRSSTYKENRVYFSVSVEDATGFGATTTCDQIQANSYGEGTYNYIYNKENFDYQYEGLSNRRLWPAQSVSFNSVSTGYLSTTVGGTGNVGVTIGSDIVTFATTNAMVRVGEAISLDGTMYEVKYLIGTGAASSVVLTTPFVGATNATAVLLFKYFYSILILEFTDNSFTSGADLISVARKSVYIATPAIDAGAAYTAIATGSTEGASLLSKLNTWLATTPAAPALTFAV